MNKLTAEKVVEDLGEEFSEIDYYRNTYYPRNRSRFVSVINDAMAAPVGSALEIGSGFGDLVVALAKLGWRVGACDYFLPLSEEKQKKYGIDYRKINIEADELPFADETFDLVVMSEVLEHLNYSPAKPLKEIFRVLKKGGRLILTTPNIANLNQMLLLLAGKNVYPEMEHYYIDIQPAMYKNFPYFDRHSRLYTKPELERLLAGLGFRELKTSFHVENVTPGSSPLKSLISKLAKSLLKLTNWRLLGEYVLISGRKPE